MENLFEQYRFDVMVNLAVRAGVLYSINNPDLYIESNIIGFYNILEACRHYPVDHLAYASKWGLKSLLGEFTFHYENVLLEKII